MLKEGNRPDFTEISVREFSKALSSADPVPGGGGAAALAGALGAALGNMVGSLTVGKKKYAEVEDEIKEIMETGETLISGLLDQIEADASGFAPLAKAYSIPKDSPDRAGKIEAATLRAIAAPFRIMELSLEALELTRVFAEKGSVMAVSDAGCSAALLRAAVEAASLNIYINTKALMDREVAQELNALCDELLLRGRSMADAVFNEVWERLRING